jgi:hypothetical protein
LLLSLWATNPSSLKQAGGRLISEALSHVFNLRKALTRKATNRVAMTAIYQVSMEGDAKVRVSEERERAVGHINGTVARVASKLKPDANRKKFDHPLHPVKADHSELVPVSNCPRLTGPLSYLPADRPPECQSNDRYLASALFCNQLPHFRLVVLVLSAPQNYRRRQEARSNWLRSRFLMTSNFTNQNTWGYAFVVGAQEGFPEHQQHLQAEACYYKDILKVNVQEGYYNLTWKKVEAFKYLIQSGIDFEVVLKTDDDCYINLQLVLEWLPDAARRSYSKLHLKGQSKKLFYSGHCPPKFYPSRNPNSKWSVSKQDYNNTVYPSFCFGAGYFLSYDLLNAVIHLPDLKETFRLEDVHTGILVNETGLLPSYDSITQALRVYNFPVGECGWRGEKRYPLITSGGSFEYKLRVFHTFLNQTKC